MITIFSDFDGVLFDSVKEAYLLARFAYKGVNTKEKIEEKEYQKFRKLRYLISKSWQFYYIFKLILNNTQDEIFESEYKKCIKTSDGQKASDFDRKYVTAREDLIKEDYEFWDNLDTPFDFFFKIKELSQDKNYNFIILTNKKKLPVQNKLKKYSFKSELFANEDLQKYSSKGEFMQEYMKENNIKNCYFIDDSIDNINDCLGYNNIKCLLAGWGYIAPSQKGLNQKKIIEIIKKEI